MRIYDIQRARHSPANHTHNHHREEEIGPNPTIHLWLFGRPPKPIQARAAKDKLGNNQHHPKLWLVDAFIPARQRSRAPIREQSREREAEDRADKSASVHVSRFQLAEPQRRAEEDGGEGYADEDREADHYALDQTGPEDAWVEEQREWAEEEGDVGFVCFATVERRDGLPEGSFWGWRRGGGCDGGGLD